MHVISKRPFNEAAKRHPNQRDALLKLLRELEKAAFERPDEIRKVFPTLDNFKYKQSWWVLDLGGNNLRIIACIQFQGSRMYVKHICSHAEYDKLCTRYRKGEL